MRKSGDTTNKICWNLSIFNNDKEIFNRDFKTLKDISNELGLSYNIVSEMSLGRKKNKKGKFDTKYFFTRI